MAQSKLDKVLSNIEKLNTELICIQEVNKANIGELNARQMWETGKTSKGTDILPAYSKPYLKHKIKIGFPTFVHLRDTGAFHKKMVNKLKGNKIEVYSTDEKHKWLSKRYADIYGLNKDYIDIAIKERIGFIRKRVLNNILK